MPHVINFALLINLSFPKTLKNFISTQSISITRGAGFIGFHTSVVLLASVHKLLVLDNLSNVHVNSLLAVSSIAGVPLDGHRFQFVHGDVRDAPFA